MPSSIPKLTEPEIRSRFDSGSYSRGQSYFRNRHVVNPAIQGNKLRAEVIGSDTYRTEVSFRGTALENSSCSCPLGGGCKHVVALLLTWVQRPQEFREVTDPRQLLASRDREQLIDLILKMLERQPEFEALLELPVVNPAGATPPINPDVIRRQVRSAQGDQDEYPGGGDFHKINRVIDLGDDYGKAGAWHNSLTVYQTVIDEVLENHEDYSDHEGYLGGIVEHCSSGLQSCLEDSNDPLIRLDALRVLWQIYHWDINQGGIGEGDTAYLALRNHSNADEKKVIAEWVRQELQQLPVGNRSSDFRRTTYGGFLLQLEGENLDDETYLRICRQSGRFTDLTDRLLQLGRIDEAQQAVSDAQDYDLLQTAASFTKYQQDALFARLLEARSSTSKDTRLYEWLKQYYIRTGNQAQAIKTAEAIFWIAANLDRYKALRELAQKTPGWNTQRAQLLNRLQETREKALAIRIHLHDGELDTAIGLLQEVERKQSKTSGMGWIALYDEVKLEIAAVCGATHPDFAINAYRAVAEKLIQQKDRKAYAAAAAHLAKAAAVYRQHNRAAELAQVMGELRGRYKNLRALQEELGRVRV